MRRFSGVVEGALGFIVVIALFVAVALTVVRVAGANWMEWNDGRLAPSAALLHGYELYYPDGEGPLLGHVYGPVSAFFYALPVLLASTPAAAIWLGSVATFLIYILPVLWLLIRESQGRWQTAAAAFLCFWLYTFHVPMLTAPAFNIHADAPALGFGALACGLALVVVSRPHTWGWVATALLVVLSVGSKQVMFALPLAIAVYVGLARGRADVSRFLLWVGAVGIATLLSLALVIDFHAMIFNAVILPSSHPWRGAGGIAALVQSFRDLAPRVMPAGLALTAVVGAQVAAGRLRWTGLRDWSRGNGWLLVLIVGVLNTPASLAGRAKIGGSMNTIAFTTYFVFAAAAMALAHLGGRDDRVGRVEIGVAARAGLLVALLSVTVWSLPMAAEVAGVTRLFTENPESAAFDYARRHPGRVYFPFNPLIPILASGEAHHFSDAIYARELAGLRVTEEHFRRWIPERVEMIATRREYEDYSLRFLTGHRIESTLAELPGWKILRREQSRVSPRR